MEDALFKLRSGFPWQRLSRPVSGQVRALGDAALIRWHGDWFSWLAQWLALKIPLVAPLLPSCTDIFHTDKPLKNPSRCTPRWCALVL